MSFTLSLLLWISFKCIPLNGISELDTISFTTSSHSDAGTPATVTVTLWFQFTKYQFSVTAPTSDSTYSAGVNEITVLGSTDCVETKIMIENDGTDAVYITSVHFSTTSDWYGIAQYCIPSSQVPPGIIATWKIEDSLCDIDYDHYEATCIDTQTGECVPSKQLLYFDTSLPNEDINNGIWSSSEACTETRHPTNNPSPKPTPAPAAPDTICVWGATDQYGDYDRYNGEYTKESTSHNEYPWWSQSVANDNCATSDKTAIFVSLELALDQMYWTLYTSPTELWSPWQPDCEDQPLPSDPTRCTSNGWFIYYDSTDYALVYPLSWAITASSCPTLSCPRIQVTESGISSCDNIFSKDYSQDYMWTFVNTFGDITYLYFNIYTFKWYCSDTDGHMDCADDSTIEHQEWSSVSDEWADVSIDESFTISVTTGSTATFECLDTMAPTEIPTLGPTRATPAPTQIPTSTPVNAPTFTPTPAPTFNPTSVDVTANPTFAVSEYVEELETSDLSEEEHSNKDNNDSNTVSIQSLLTLDGPALILLISCIFLALCVGILGCLLYVYKRSTERKGADKQHLRDIIKNDDERVQQHVVKATGSQQALATVMTSHQPMFNGKGAMDTVYPQGVQSSSNVSGEYKDNVNLEYGNGVVSIAQNDAHHSDDDDVLIADGVTMGAPQPHDEYGDSDEDVPPPPLAPTPYDNNDGDAIHISGITIA